MKKRITKAVSLIAAVTLITGVFTSCGKNVSDKDEQGRTIISVAGYPSKEGEKRDNFDANVEKFEQDNPDVVVKPTQWSFDLKSFYAKAAAGNLPLIFNTHFTEVEQCIASGYSADITDVLHKRGYDGMFNEKVLDVLSDDNGRIYAFPTNAYVLGMGVNIELFEKAGLMEPDGTPKQPKTWEEVTEFAVKIKEATGKAGLILPSAGNQGGWILTPIMWSYGVEFMKQDSNGKWKATFNSPEAVAALEWIQDLKWKYNVLPSNTLIDSTEHQKQFATGNAGMLICAASIPHTLLKYDFDPNNLGMIAFPAGPKRHVTLLGGSANSFAENATEDQLDAAIRWTELKNYYKLTEDYKRNKEEDIKIRLEDNELVGIVPLSIWSENAETVKFDKELISEKTNVNKNHVRLYNEFVEQLPCDIQAEEPVCAQELYAILDGVVQEVLTNKNADCSKLIKKACSDFQLNYLDNLTY